VTGAGEEPKPVTRRNFIVWYLAGLLSAIAVVIPAGLLVYAWPKATGGKVREQNVTVTLDRPLDQLQENQALQFNSPPNTGFKMVNGGGDNYPGKVTFGAYAIRVANEIIILSVTCSHLGCSVQFDNSAHTFNCPCHGSIFNIDGQVLHGPALAPLSNLGWKLGSSLKEIVIEGYSLQGVG
jgi:Rieske Fe-S protein